MFKRLLPRHLTLIAIALTSIASACGDDSDDTTQDAGPADGGAQGGKGGKDSAAGKGGSGGKGGTAGGSEVGGSGGSAPVAACTEDAPASPFKCGDETCTVPEFENNPCVVPCCIEIDGEAKCGAKSTSEMFPAACALPAVADSQCPAVAGAMGGGEMVGCCNAEKGKCGIISSARPGCITESTFVEIPDQTCTVPDTDGDAGVDLDAG